MTRGFGRHGRIGMWLGALLMLAGFGVDPALSQPGPAASIVIHGRDDRQVFDNGPKTVWGAIGAVITRGAARAQAGSAGGSQTAGRGTGVLIGRCHVLTAAHVVAPAVMDPKGRTRILFQAGNGKAYAAETVARGETAAWPDDWAVLRLQPCPEGLKPARINGRPIAQLVQRRLQLGHAGFPVDRAGAQPLYDPDCRIQAFADDGGVLHDCSGGSGSSGGPLLRQDRRGNLIVVAIYSATPLYAFGQIATVAKPHPLMLSRGLALAPLLPRLRDVVPDLRAAGFAEPAEVGLIPGALVLEQRFASDLMELARDGDAYARLHLCLQVARPPQPAPQVCRGLAEAFRKEPQILRNPQIALQAGVVRLYGLGLEGPDLTGASEALIGPAELGVGSALLLLGVILEASPDSDAREIAALYDRAIEAGMLEGLFRRARLEHRLGDPARALEMYRAAASRGHAEAQAMVQLWQGLPAGQVPERPPAGLLLPPFATG